jgi:RNA polymerase sigma-70 factor (ECF subfamily)
MDSPVLPTVLRLIGALTNAGGDANLSDAELLGQFVARRDETAFATLLERHGPLVLGICRAMLGNICDAEDAFQATFLVLAKKAASICKQESLAAWLHQVALNISRTARLGESRRRSHERQAVLMPQATSPEPETPPDWQPILHQEVDLLPEKYRVAVILCYFQGKTHEQAAGQLGWPLGTVKGRLARARGLLRARLARRGVALPAGGIVAALAEKASAAVPPALSGLTLRAAVSFAAGSSVSGAAASAHVITLARGAIRTMTATRLVHGILLLLAVGVALFGAALGIGAGWDTLQGGRTQATQQRDSGGTLDPAAHPDQQDPSAKALPPASDPTKVPPADFGPEVEGLRAKVTLAREKFEVGEATLVKYVVNNVSHAEQVIWHRGFWPNHVLVVKDADGKEPPLTEFGSQCRKAFSPNRTHGGKRVPVKVPPGGEDGAYEEYDLTKHFHISRPGRYTVQYLYDDRQPEGGWAGQLPSNVVAFEVVARREKKGEESPPRAEGDPTKVKGPEQVLSDAVRVADVDFQVVCDAKWQIPPTDRNQFVEMGLRLMNRGEKTLLFNLDDTLKLGLKTADGKPIKCKFVPLRAVLPRPVVLGKGETKTIYIHAKLWWTREKTPALALVGTSLTGGAWQSDNLTSGKYLLHVEYENTEKTQADFVKASKFQPEAGQVFWVNKAMTADVAIEVVTPVKPDSDLSKVSVEDLARELTSQDGARRVLASRELLRRGTDILKDLEKAGAKEVLPIVSPTEKQPMSRRLDLVYSLIRGLPQVDPKSQMGIRMNRITLRLAKGVTRAEFDRMERQYKFGLHVERQDMFRPDAATVCDVVLTEEWEPAARPATEKLEHTVEEILTTEPRVETIDLIVPVKSQG